MVGEMSNLMKCQRRSCGVFYNPAMNKDDSCFFHPGPLMIKDGDLLWFCCSSKATVTEGCTYSFHTNEEPLEYTKPHQMEDIEGCPGPRAVKLSSNVDEKRRKAIAFNAAKVSQLKRPYSCMDDSSSTSADINLRLENVKDENSLFCSSTSPGENSSYSSTSTTAIGFACAAIDMLAAAATTSSGFAFSQEQVDSPVVSANTTWETRMTAFAVTMFRSSGYSDPQTTISTYNSVQTMIPTESTPACIMLDGSASGTQNTDDQSLALENVDGANNDVINPKKPEEDADKTPDWAEWYTEKRKVTKFPSMKSLFDEVKRKSVCDSKLKFYQKKFKEIVLDSNIVPNLQSLIYFTLEYLSKLKDSCIEPGVSLVKRKPIEIIILETFIEIDSEFENKVVESFLTNCYHILLSTTKHPHGLASTMRVYVGLCKQKSFKSNVLKLCVKLLKKKHRYAPYFIANAMKVWREIFVVKDEVSENPEILILQAIFFGSQIKPLKMNMMLFNWSSSIINSLKPQYLPELPDIFVLFKNLITSSTETDKAKRIACCLVVFSTSEPWFYIQKHIVETFVIPHLKAFYNDQKTEHFEVMCKLCLDLHLSGTTLPLNIFLHYFSKHPTSTDFPLSKCTSCIETVFLKFVVKY